MTVRKRSRRRSWLWMQELAPDFEPLSRPRCLGTGEDPRLFRFRGRRYVLSYDWYRNQLETRYFLHDLESDARLSLRIEGDPFQGKNWVPFEYDDGLLILHALDPLGILRCDVESGRCRWVHHDAPEQIAELSWKDPAGRIGTRRGGTPGCRVGGSLVLGFGHDTLCGTREASHHVPFLWVLDMGGPGIRFFEPDHPNPEGLVDPTSWYVRGSDVVVLTTQSAGSWCYPQRFEARFEVVPGGLETLAERTGLPLASLA
jgi:hypothetical protein